MSMTKNITAAIIMIVTLASCGSSEEEADRHIVEGSSHIFDSNGEFDEESAKADAIANVSEMSFENVGDTGLCTDDCSGHEAGFEWTRDNDPENLDGCSYEDGDSFYEGCTAFHEAVEDEVEDMRQQWEESE